MPGTSRSGFCSTMSKRCIARVRPELRAYVVSETKKWADIVRAAGIEPE
jgi:hypothetical protein